MIVTTYQHDYVPPHTKRYDFFKGKEQKDKANVECQCAEENKLNIVPNTNQEQCNVEWIEEAKNGSLTEPRIIPTNLSNGQLNVLLNENQTDCYRKQPNRFLQILRNAYPNLYERLKQMPKDELSRHLDRDNMYTSYQIDFCKINENPEGLYKPLNIEDERSKVNASKVLQPMEPCADLKTNVLEELTKENVSVIINSRTCEKSYKPFQIKFADSSRFISSGNSSHWRSNIFSKKAKFSEYMDTINKIGCVIMKNNIHDHRKCSKKNCKHQLIHACTNLK